MRFILFFLCYVFIISSAHAEESGAVLSLSVENDLYVDEDNNYTSGVRLGWAGTENRAPDFVKVFGLFDGYEDRRWAFEAGQNMYSPTSLTNRPPVATDRPYAGWLYAGAAVSGKSGAARDTASITLGVVGPLSLAAESQDLIHVLGGGIRPQGWGSQLKNEPGLVLGFERKWPSLFFTSDNLFEIDASPSLYTNLGNIHTHAGINVLLRFGQGLRGDEGPPLIHPSVLGSDYFSEASSPSWYVFAGLGARGVARDIFLDGNTFQSSASVPKENVVGEFQAGAAITVYGARLSYTHVLRSREFIGQDEADSYGALNLSWRY